MKENTNEYTKRQIGVIGEAAQESLQQSVVAIYCLDSAALEIAKNLLLSGIKELLLCDSSVFHLNDLSTNVCFFLLLFLIYYFFLI